MVLIKRSGVDAQVRHDKETSRMIRAQEDRLSGLTRAKGPERGDYKFCDTTGQMLRDMKKYPKDRARISKEYHEFQKSQRKYG